MTDGLAEDPRMPLLRRSLRTLDGDRATAIGHEEGEALFRLVRQGDLHRTLEIGFAYGFSAAYILSASHTVHVAIDPHSERYGELGLSNLAAVGVADRIQLEREPAHVVLPRLLADGRRFDFAFVDGDHKFDTTFVEFYYLDLLIDTGGIVVFHDAWMRSIRRVAAWIRTNKSNYHFIEASQPNLIVVRKTGDDVRAWHHFAEFGPRRTFAGWIRSRLVSRIRPSA